MRCRLRLRLLIVMDQDRIDEQGTQLLESNGLCATLWVARFVGERGLLLHPSECELVRKKD